MESDNTVKILTGIRDTDLIILSQLDDKALFNFCISSKSKYLKKLCSNETFWRKRFINKFGSESLNLKFTDSTWKKFYLKLIYYLDKGGSVENAFDEASLSGDLEAAQFFLEDPFSKNVKDKLSRKIRLNRGMRNSAKGGHKNLINYFVSEGADYWNGGLVGAAEAGRKDLIDFFISKGANFWDGGLHGAAKAGRKDLVHFFIKKGADDWIRAIRGAALGRHKDLIDFFLEKKDNITDLAICLILEDTIKGGHEEILEYIKEKFNINDYFVKNIKAKIDAGDTSPCF